MSRLALGGAQFGSHYGITNATGQVSGEEVRAILTLARKSGIDTIDTARLYGDSEAVIGHCHNIAGDFRIASKTERFGAMSSSSEAVRLLQAAFASSLEALRRPALYALLVHDPRDLLGPLGSAIWSSLEDLKALGQVQKIGVSVYEADEVDAIMNRYPVEIVQVPFNALDQRLVQGGQLQALDAAGVEVHARSIFLQGLLLAAPSDLPRRFIPLRAYIEQLDKAFSQQGLNRLQGLLAVGIQRSEISRLVVGVTSAKELNAIVAAATGADTARPLDLSDIPEVDSRFLNPTRWAELEIN